MPLASLAVPVRFYLPAPGRVLSGLMVAGGVLIVTTGAVPSTTKGEWRAGDRRCRRHPLRTRGVDGAILPGQREGHVLAPVAGCHAPLLMLTSTSPTPDVASAAVPPITGRGRRSRRLQRREFGGRQVAVDGQGSGRRWR